MQIAVIEFARNVCDIKDASSTEFIENCSSPVIDLMSDQKNIVNMGGTLRLGNYECTLKKGTIANKIYNTDKILERHRHRYEFNNDYRELLQEKGLCLCGQSPDGYIVEAVELTGKRFFVGVQFHPEFKSRPNHPHPLFKGLISASMEG